MKYINLFYAVLPVFIGFYYQYKGEFFKGWVLFFIGLMSLDLLFIRYNIAP